ncbi:hypothetical protein [uncultured Roseobacter sp.]|uniref:hypothetical protein n=1 Tax=uncultured Roseobacter sp. TaxID=114847 RepID=UPI0026204138|nr:hypothetical protein [uncultured Roseobacter sp.]
MSADFCPRSAAETRRGGKPAPGISGTHNSILRRIIRHIFARFIDSQLRFRMMKTQQYAHFINIPARMIRLCAALFPINATFFISF